VPEPLPISSFPLLDRSEWPPDVERLATQFEADLGFVPNLIRAWAWRPDRLRAWYAHYRQLLEPSPGLSLAEREMIAVAVSAANQCDYCLASHGAALRMTLGDADRADQLALDPHAADLDPRAAAIVEYAVALTDDPASCDAAAIDVLQDHGLDIEDIWDVIEISAMFNFTNRLTQGTGMVPNTEYQTLGRPTR
jgi:uncharacterized peroxidase-related enzyme